MCWIPSHCKIYGNEQADRIAKRSLNLHSSIDIKIPKFDLLRIIKNKIYKKWQQEFNQIPIYKIKSNIEQWNTSFQKNRHHETVLAHLRLNCVREIHLIPHIENNFPLICNCDGSRLNLHHIFFDCSFYIAQRYILLQTLHNDKKNINLKNVLEDNQKYCNLVIQFLKSINFINKI